MKTSASGESFFLLSHPYSNIGTPTQKVNRIKVITPENDPDNIIPARIIASLFGVLIPNCLDAQPPEISAVEKCRGSK